MEQEWPGNIVETGVRVMRHAIETAPRDGTVVILEHDPTGTSDVAYWSDQAAQWVAESGAPSRIQPTHWRSMPHDQYLRQEFEPSSDPAPPKRWSLGARVVAGFLIAVALFAAAFMRIYLDSAPGTFVANEGSRTAEMPVQQSAAKATMQAATPLPRPSPEKEPPRDALLNELAEARQAIEGLDAQLRADAAKSAQLLDQEQKKTAALAQEATAARQELTASTAGHRQALDEERARSAALASELAAVRRDSEAQAAQLRKASEDFEQLRQAKAADKAADSAQLLDQARQKADALAQEAAAARRALTASTAAHHQALDEERAHSAALASTLATAQRDNEMQAAQLRAANDDLERLKQAKAVTGAPSPDQERQATDALAREAAAARQELTASKAKYDQALDAERARSAALANALATAQRDNETQAAQLLQANADAERLKQADAASKAQLRDQERQTTDALAQAAAARQALTAGTAEHHQALDEERARSASLASTLATAQRDGEMQAAQLRKASEDAEQFRKADAASSAQALDQEREKTAALAEAAAARQELAAGTERHRQALDEQRARTAALAEELATARRDNAMQAAQLQKASEETQQLRRTTESSIMELRQSLQQERDRAEAVARDIEAGRRATDIRAVPEAALNTGTAGTAQVANAAATVRPASADTRDDPEATKLISRARTLLGQGNIGAARTVLQRAVEAGSPLASFTLAETYDPAILSTWGTYGTRGDAKKAREFYARAQAGGISDAKDRLEKLDR